MALENLYLLKKLLITKCIKDPSFKDKLLKNPKEALKQELNIQLPEEIRINVYEDTEQTFNIVLPSKKEIESYDKKDYELSEEELQAVSGGTSLSERYEWYEKQRHEWEMGRGENPDKLKPPPTVSE